MVHSEPTLASSTRRPLRLALRQDLQVQVQNYLGRQYWIIKDPISLKYFRFEEEEYRLLSWLDGATSLEQLKRRFEAQFAPQKISVSEIHQFMGRMYRVSLLVSDSWGQGQQLYERFQETQRRNRRAAWSNFMAIRFRGIDPDRFLGGVNRWLGWVFSGPAVLAGVALMLAAAMLLGVQFDIVQHRLPRFQQFFGAGNWFWLAVTLSLTKVLHEMGHGLACRRLGGRCHEAGVMLLLFMPCLYCNVTDSWMIPSKWKRAAIGAAGMYVELLLAAICTFLWWFSVPGFFNGLCLNVMFVWSISTLLFNANPLMRYDGYYILSDLVEIPNLRQKASVVVQRWCMEFLLGIPQPSDPFLPHRRVGWFALYAVAATAYRWVIAFSIFWFLYQLLEPYGLKIVGQVLAVLGVYGLLVRPLVHFLKFMATPGRIQQVKASRVALSGAGLAIAGMFLAAYPFPYYLPSVSVVQPHRAETVFVRAPGRVVDTSIVPGAWVNEGDLLLELESHELDQEVQQSLGQWMVAATRLASARQEARFDDETWDLVPPLQESVRVQREHYEALMSEAESLVIRAPRSGYVLTPREKFVSYSTERQVQLPIWRGAAFDEVNRGAYIESATVVCQIGDPETLEVVLAVPQEQMEFLRTGQQVDVLFPHLAGRRFSTQISRIAPTKMERVVPALDSRYGGPIVTEINASGQSEPLQATYEVICRLEDPDHVLAVGMTGHARIQAGRRSLGQRFLRYLSQTFSFRM